jgi:hypothetical protein
MVERLNLCLSDFRFLNSSEHRSHRPRCSSQVSESAASNSPSKNACKTNAQSGQAPTALVPDSGAGGGTLAMRTELPGEKISWLA